MAANCTEVVTCLATSKQGGKYGLQKKRVLVVTFFSVLDVRSCQRALTGLMCSMRPEDTVVCSTLSAGTL